MAILDPSESRRIAELLDANQPVAAADVLLKSKHSQHRAIRPLVSRCVDALMEMARSAFEKCSIDTARAHALLAQKLHALSGDQLRLFQAIEVALAASDNRTAAERERLASARTLSKAGRHLSTIEHLEPIRHLDEAQALIRVSEADRKTYERHCDDCERLLEASSFQAATVAYSKAKSICPEDIRIIGIGEKYAEELGLDRNSTNLPSAERAPYADRPVTRDDRGFVLDFGDPAINTLVLFGNTVVIGAAKDHQFEVRGTPPDIPLQQAHFLNEQQAVLFRHLRHGRMNYYLAPHPSSYKDRCRVIVQRDNDEEEKCRLQIGDNLACIQLQDADVIRFVGGHKEASHTLVFRQPFERKGHFPVDSGLCMTAVLEVADDVANSSNDVSTAIRINDVVCHYVALMYDELTVGLRPGKYDVPIPALISGSITLQICDNKLTLSSERLRLLVHGINGEEYEDEYLRFDCIVKVRPCRVGAHSDQIIAPQSPLVQLSVRRL